MTSEEELKRKMLLQKQQEMMQAQFQAVAEQQQMEQQLAIIRAMMTKILEPKARERLSNLRLVKPQVALQIEVYLAQLYQAGHIKQPLTDQQLVQILSKLTAQRETQIKRK